MGGKRDEVGIYGESGRNAGRKSVWTFVRPLQVGGVAKVLLIIISEINRPVCKCKIRLLGTQTRIFKTHTYYVASNPPSELLNFPPAPRALVLLKLRTGTRAAHSPCCRLCGRRDTWTPWRQRFTEPSRAERVHGFRRVPGESESKHSERLFFKTLLHKTEVHYKTEFYQIDFKYVKGAYILHVFYTKSFNIQLPDSGF